MPDPDDPFFARPTERGRSGVLGHSNRQPGPEAETTTHPKVVVPETEMERLLDAAYRALPLMPEQIRDQVAELLTPQAMAIIAGVAAVWAGSHFFGVGVVVDVVFAGVAFATIGWDAIRAMRGFVRYYDLAVHARTEPDLDAAARSFAEALLAIISAVGWGKLGHWLGKGVRRVAVVEKAAVQLSRWKHFIDAIQFKVPKNQGMLWSKLGDSRAAERLARQKGLVSLEMELKKTGFFTLYNREFGKVQNEITQKIWTMVSERYVQSLEGQVTGYVHRAKHFEHIRANAEKAAKAAGKDMDQLHEFKKLINPGDPVIVHEVDEITQILLRNPKITELTLIDVKTGEAFGYRSRELLESLQRLERQPSIHSHWK